MIEIRATIRGRAAEMLSALSQNIGQAGREELNRAGADSLGELIRAHLQEYAATAHKTADNIPGGPATYSGHLTKAEESITSDATAAQGTVSIQSPGFRRAFGPLPIHIRQRQWLTIPAHADAYNQTVDSLRRAGKTIFRPGGREFLATSEKINGKWELKVLFWLRKQTTLKHEPKLLPTENEMGTAAANGVADEILNIAQKIGLL